VVQIQRQLHTANLDREDENLISIFRIEVLDIFQEAYEDFVVALQETMVSISAPAFRSSGPLISERLSLLLCRHSSS